MNVKLTRSQVKVLKHIATGLTDKEVSEVMGIGERTVRRHLENARWALGAVNRVNAIAIAIREKIIE